MEKKRKKKHYSKNNTKQETLDGSAAAAGKGAQIFLQEAFWPAFDEDGAAGENNATALGIDAVRWIVTAKVDTAVC